MNNDALKQQISELLTHADVKINGDRPFDIRVNDERFYGRVLSQGSLGFGESYMDGWWDCEQLDVMIHRVLGANLEKKIQPWRMAWPYLKARFINLQTKNQAFDNGQAHYDIGNDLYERMLDKRMVYTCAYFKDAQTLDEAQEAKLDLVCKKIGLKKGDRVLDIGCGWGSWAKFAAEKYGASVVGITVSKEQVALGQERCKGLPVEIRLQDYRDVNEPFDHIISLGMFEHVGYKNYRDYMAVAARCLKDGGLFLLHTIGGNTSTTSIDPWIEKYIFPNAMLPSVKQISAAAEGLFVMEDWHSFGQYYDLTLMAWYKNFHARWPEISQKYGERFYRMWRFYLLVCAGSFRCRKNQLWQIVFSKHGVSGGYKSIR